MACTKTELVEAINSYAASQTTKDRKLQTFAVQELEAVLNKIDFEEEKEAEE